MVLLGLVGFALQCFDVLAWPFFALVYPLYSSIRAIETNSITDTHKINTYWVVFSLILLFEHAFMKLLEWFLLWPYIRLLIVFFLVMPHFDGALYVYKHLICPCLSMDPQIVINLFNKRKESFVRDNFLSEVERYVKENGPEGLERFIACKSTRTNLDVKEFNAVSSMDTEASKSIKPNGGQNDIKALQVMAKKKETTASQVSQAEPNLTVNEDKFSSTKMNEKAIEGAADREILKTPAPKKVQKEWTTVSPLQTQTDATLSSPLGDNKDKATYEALKIKNEAEPKLTWPEKRAVAAMDIYAKPVEVGTGIEDPETPKEVQKEWTCALCQLITTCESNLNSHLQGRKHKAAYEALKARNQAFLPKIAPASTAKTSNQPNQVPGKSSPSSGSKQKVSMNENSKSIEANGGQNDIKAVQVTAKKKETTASQVSQAEPNLTVNEDKFSSTTMNEKAIEGAADREILKTPAPKKVQKEWTTVSPLQTQTDATLSSPLGDNKDKATYEALKIKNEAEPKLTWPEKRAVAAMEIYEKPVEVGTGIEDPETPKEVQKEWTCALCQLTTTCESNLNSHLQGRKHKAAYEALKARNQAFLPKIAPASTAKTSNQPNEVPGKSSPSSGSKQMGTINENSTRINLNVKEFNAVSSKDNEASKSIEANGGQNDIKAVQVTVKKMETTASQVSQAEPNLTVNEDKFSSTKMNEKAIEGAADREILKTPAPKKVQKEWTTVSPLQTQTDATLSSPLGDNKDKATYEALKIKNEAEPKLTWPEKRAVAAMEIYEKPVEVGTGIEDPETPKEVQKEWTCALCQVTTTCESNLNSHLQGRKHKAAYEALKARNQAFLPKIAPASTAKTSNQPNEVPGKSSPSSGSKQMVTMNENSKSIEANGGQNDIKAVQVTAKKKETTASQVSQAEPNLTVNEDKFSSRKMNEKAIEVAADGEILNTPPRKKVQKEWTTVSPLQTQTDATLSSPLGDNKDKATYEALKIKNEAEPKLTWPEKRAVAAMEIYEKPVEVGTGIEDPETPKEVQKEWTCALCQVTTTCESNLNSHLQGRKHKAAYEALKARNQAFLPKIAPASTAKTSNQPNEVPGKSSPSSGSKQMVTINENSKSVEANGGQNDIKAVQVTAKKKETTASQVSQAEPNLTVNEDKFSSTKMNEKAIEGAADREILETPAPKKVQKEWTTVSPLQTQTDATLSSPLGDNKDKATYEALKIKNEAEPKLTWPEKRAVAAMEIYEKPVEVGTGIEDPETPKEVQKEWTCALCQVTTTCESNLNSHLQGRKHKAAYEALKARNQAFLPKIAPASTAKTSNQPNKEPGKSSPSSGSKQKVSMNENSKSIEANGGQNDIKAVQVTAKKKETTASQVSQAEPNLTVNEDKFSSTKMKEKAIEGAADREILETPAPKKVQKEWTTVSPLQTQTDATLSSPLGDNKDKATYEALKIKNEAEPKLTWPEKRAVAAMEIYEKPVEVGTVIEDPEPPKEVQKEWTCALSQVTTTCERNLNSHLQGRKHKAAYEAPKAGNQAFVPKIAPASTAKTSNQPNKEPGKSIPSSGSKQKVTVNENVQGQKNSSPAPITKKHYKPKEELADGVSSNGQKRKIAIQVEKVQSQQPKPNEVPRVKSCPLRCEICSVSCSDEIDLLSHLNGKKHKENVQEQQEYLIRVGEFDIYW
ncbi:hypothetical protein ABKV19_000045 [Rosa sericea]